MQQANILTTKKARYLTAMMLAATSFLLPVKNLYAAASLNLSSEFVPVDVARQADPYMDAGGTWNGTTEVSNSSGDRFSLTLTNTAADILTLTDTAFNLSLNVTVDAGFRLPTSPFNVSVQANPANNIACETISGITATQASSGAPITFNFTSPANVLPTCKYRFDLGLSTVATSPSVVAGNYSLTFDLSYNDDLGNAQPQPSVVQAVQVREGELALLKVADTALAGDGQQVQFTVSVLSAGQGGVFDVILTDILSADLTNLNINAPFGNNTGLAANQHRLPYLAAGQQVDIIITADVAVDANATACPNLRNDASVLDRLGHNNSGFDAVPFNLQNPFLNYTAQNINIPFGAAGTTITVPVQNSGTGVAKNISLSVANLAAFAVVVDNVLSPAWRYAGAGLFVYSGTLAAAASADLVFNISTNTCPPPAGAALNWIPAYQNACGTDFFPPLGFSSVAVNNIPDLTINKVVSSAALNIGQPGSYSLNLAGTNVANLPDDKVADNQDFIITDLLPIGVTGVVINNIPATTDVLVNGVAYSVGNVIPDNASLLWRGDRADLQPLPSLQIDFTAGAAGLCPVGQVISNAATLNYPACSIINPSNAANFILSENPAGETTLNINVGGDGVFEAGDADNDGVFNRSIEPREGEHIPFSVDYSFPVGFVGGWSGSSFTADLRASAGSESQLQLINNRNSVVINVTRISDGANICANLTLNPNTDFSGGGTGANAGALVISDLGNLSGCNLPVSMADHNLRISYTATSAEGTLDASGNPSDDINIGSYVENTTLTVASGIAGCLGTADFVQGVGVTIERAVLDLTATLNNGNPVSVCSAVPVTLNLAGTVAGTSSDNLLLQFNDTNFEFVNAAGNAGDVNTDLSFAGSLDPSTVNILASRSGNDILMPVNPITQNVSAAGAVSFFVRLRNNTLPAQFTAQLDFDSNARSPDRSGNSDDDRDYNVPILISPNKVLTGQLEMEFFPPNIILRDTTQYTFRAQITNVGTGTAVGAKYRIIFPAGFIPNQGLDVNPFTLTVSNAGQTFEYDLGDMAAGSSINLEIIADINRTTCFQDPSEFIQSENEWGCGSPIINSSQSPGIILPTPQLQLRFDNQSSFCELCAEGEIHLFVNNTGGVQLTDIVVDVDLRLPNLTIVANAFSGSFSTQYIVDGGAPIEVNHQILGGDVEQLRWDSSNIAELAALNSGFGGSPQEIEIIFKVRRNLAAGITEEGLISANRNIQANANFGLFCGPPPQTATSGTYKLPIRQPLPEVLKLGRNVDANQPAGRYTDTVFGGRADDVIWRVEVQNSASLSRADLQDMIMDYRIDGGADLNFDIDFVCNSEINASLAAGGASPGAPNCISLGAGLVTVDAPPRAINDPFGNPNNDATATLDVDVVQGGSAFVYYVGKIQNQCSNQTNRSRIEWGCTVDAPDGGINAPADGILSFSNNDTANLNTQVDPNGMSVVQVLRAADGRNGLGTRGTVTLTINNNTGGSVRELRLTDILPTGYALDPQQINGSNVLPTALTVTSVFGDYTGRIDTLNLSNNSAPTFENNNAPAFVFSSSDGIFPQNNLMRNGDVIVLLLNVVRISDFDLMANPEIATESAANGSDPTESFTLINSVALTFEDSCANAFQTSTFPLLKTVNNDRPEDLDINIDPNNNDKVYVLSDPTDTLSLDVVLRNNGGHNAKNYFAMVTVGNGLTVTAKPNICIAQGSPDGAGNPPAPIAPRVVSAPALPSTSTVYLCDQNATLGRGAVRTYTFNLQKAVGTDLTFRADVVAEITLADGVTPLTFPAVNAPNVANNYSFDSIRARIIGFNLNKTILNCREQNVLPADTKIANVQIGEDCTYRLSVGWFGFATPGFGQISIGNIQIVDDIPAGQGFISAVVNTSSPGTGTVNLTADTFSSTPAAIVAPNEITQAVWTFNQGAALNNIQDDLNIDIDWVSRTRNDALDSSAAPNNHGANITDTLNVSFEVDFDGSGSQLPVTFALGSPNYPPLSARQARLNIAEPNLVINKQVCNETGDVAGAACSNFVDLVEGDINDIYTYRIRITNTATVGGVASKAAFDVVVTDTLDLFSEVISPALDGIDNIGDAAIDSGTETSIIINGTPPTGPPARSLIFDASSVPALAQINAGTTVDLYYRVDPDDSAVPGQILSNNLQVDYDSLNGIAGSQDAPQIDSTLVANAAGARRYQLTDSADIRLLVPSSPPDSKAILRTTLTVAGDTLLCTPAAGNRFCTGIAPDIQRVSIGDEVEYRLEVDLPAASYSNLIIRDELPAGITCIEAANVVLDADFAPSASIVATSCDGNLVEWNLGNRTVVALPLKPLVATFIARVDNINTNRDGVIIRNGGSATLAVVRYTDQNSNVVDVPMGPADISLREASIVLSKSFGVITSADADDELTVTVTATNTAPAGSVPAYNVRILDDLTLTPGLDYLANVAGSNPPNIETILAADANQPIFIFNQINANSSVSFSFQVKVNIAAQPLEILANTLQASWQSLPSQSSALNSSGLLGADGSASGLRNGALPNVADSLNNYETSVSNNSVSVPRLAITKAETLASVPVIAVIGERKTFQIDLHLPEGSTHNIVLTDNLAFSTESYVIENIRYQYTNIVSINGLVMVNGVEQSSPPAAPFIEPAVNSTGNVVWNIGTVVTAAEVDPLTNLVNPSIRITYDARIDNVAAIQAGTTLRNRVSVIYDSGSGGSDNRRDTSSVVTVREANLSVLKTVNNVTAGKLAADRPDAGDTLLYVVNITNVNTATAAQAFDLNIQDQLPANLIFDNSFTPTAFINGVDQSASFTAAPAGTPGIAGGLLIWGRINADNSLDLGVAETLQIRYQVKVLDTVEPNQTISNSARVDWTSLDGSGVVGGSADERTGDGCPNITLPNDYCSAASVAVLRVSDNHAVTKTRINDSFNNNGSVRIGDTLQYILTLSLQEGRTRGMTLLDTLPAGMVFVSVDSINGQAAPFTSAGTFTHADILPPTIDTALNTVTWNIGDAAGILNTPDADNTADDFVIIYTAQVVNDVLPITPQINNSNLQNRVLLSYLDVNNIAINDAVANPRLTDTATIVAQQPIILSTDLTLTRRSGIPSGMQVADGEVLDFNLQVCNSGTAPAYNVVIEHVLDNVGHLNIASITGPQNPEVAVSLANPVVFLNGLTTAATDGVEYDYLPPALATGRLIFTLRDGSPILPANCAVIQFNIKVNSPIGAQISWDNNLQLVNYFSLDAGDINKLERETYPETGIAASVGFNMNTIAPINAPTKTLSSPLPAEASIGETLHYEIRVPGNAAQAMHAALFDVNIVDDLSPHLLLSSATQLIGTSNYTDPSPISVPFYSGVFSATGLGSAAARIFIGIVDADAGNTKQAVFDFAAQVLNDANTTFASTAFGNTVTYDFAGITGGETIVGGSGSTSILNNVRIVEPSVTAVLNNVLNITNNGALPDAGDVLRYTYDLTAAGGAVGDAFSNAYDISLISTLSDGLAFTGTATVNGLGNIIAAPDISNNGQTLTWGLSSTAPSDIDIDEGAKITLSFDLVVTDAALATQTLTNRLRVEWTSADGLVTAERTANNNPTALPYFSNVNHSIITADNNSIVKTRLSDSFNNDGNVRIGDIVDYQLSVNLQEGTSANVQLRDTLPSGLVFAGIVSINADTAAPYTKGAPFTYFDNAAAEISFDVNSVSVDNNTGVVLWDLQNIVNSGDNNAANNTLVIVYRSRVQNAVLAQVNTIALNNSVSFVYDLAGAVTATAELSNISINVLQPDLDTLNITQTATAANGDNILDASELINYRVLISNNGTAPAYDVVFSDLIPVGLRNGVATQVMSATPQLVSNGVPLPAILPTYNPATGLARWNLDVAGSADLYTIPPGDALQIDYVVQADAGLGAGVLMINQTRIEFYYSLDNDALPTTIAPNLPALVGVREIYGPGNTVNLTPPLSTALPNALDKNNPIDSSGAIGEAFTYVVTIPAVPMGTALHDVRILDDLNLSAADLVFVSVNKLSGTQVFAPENVGDNKNLIIQDIATGAGIEVPAGEQVQIAISVMLRNQPANVSGLLYANTASYTYNAVDTDVATQAVGGGDTTGNMTVVEPSTLTLQKDGPAIIRYGIAETYTLDIQNTGTGTAWDLSIVDEIENPDPGGMCDTAPTNFTAQVFLADGTTPVSDVLQEGVDYSLTFVASEPRCIFTMVMQSPAARIAATNRLLISYQATLDVNTFNATVIRNFAYTRQWFSTDTPANTAVAEVREYNAALTDGTENVLDHEDVHSVTVEAPVLLIQKSVINLTTAQDPGLNAEPGETLRYRIFMQNNGPVAISEFSLKDEVDRLSSSEILFAPNSLLIVSVPATADASNTDPVGGVNGSGLLDIRQLSLGEAGAADDNLLIEFDVTLMPVISAGLFALNQAEIDLPLFTTLLSDDPNVNGVDDPNVLGDEDPTQTLIGAVPVFQVQKTSEDLSGDAALLEAGDRLRYTLTVKNIGVENSLNTRLRDQIPANTSYIANSTTLNGVAVADAANGISALQDGLSLHAPEDATAGLMRADMDAQANNLATVTFDVMLDNGLVIGAVISNQAFVTGKGAGSGPFPEQPSDDPDTVLKGDPTQDVVGNMPIIDAQKSVEIVVDNGVAGQVDVGDILRYSIIIANNGIADATGVVLRDALPANTAYSANSSKLNGINIADNNGLPLAAGIDISGSDLTPPLPNAGEGILKPGQAATVEFDVQVVDPGLPIPPLPAGTLISNQGFVSSNELPTEATDEDGNDENGDQPTVVVVGSLSALHVSKEVFVVGGGLVRTGGLLEYVMRVTNTGLVDATGIVLTDVMPTGVSYVQASARLNGSAAFIGIGLSEPGIELRIDYDAIISQSNVEVLEAGESFTLSFRVRVNAGQIEGTSIVNTVNVVWAEMNAAESASAAIDIGGAPGVGVFGGHIWHETERETPVQANQGIDPNLPNWTAQLRLNGAIYAEEISDENGRYQFIGLPPSANDGGDYEIRFIPPGGSDSSAAMGAALIDANHINAGSSAPMRINIMTLKAGENIPQQSMPVSPNGITYNSIVRTPVAGARISLVQDNGSPLPSACLLAGAHQQGQITLASGFYRFDVQFAAVGCNVTNYALQLEQPSSGFTQAPSVIIPAGRDLLTQLDVANCAANDVLPSTAACDVQNSAFQPPVEIGLRTAATEQFQGTTYFLKQRLSASSELAFNNHLPFDPVLEEAVAISKTTPMVNVIRSQLVPYVITLTNEINAPLNDLDLIDSFPPGFKYVQGSASIDGVKIDPEALGLQLIWRDLFLNTSSTSILKMLLIVGSGVNEGEYINRAQVQNNRTGGNASGEASATVRVVPDPTFDCSDVIGKVFDDENLNGYQDKNEAGLAAVRVVSARGLLATTDEHGRFHITCAVVPNRDRGSNFILKLDPRTLPTGYRLTTENPRVQKATRGKMLKFQFGAAIHRVVRLDMADGVFHPNTTKMRPQWISRIDMLLSQLQKAPSVLRLAYMGDIEDESLANDRLQSIKNLITEKWQQLNCCYTLTIETELFWRRGHPAKKSEPR